MRKIIFILLILPVISFAQVNRYSKSTSPSRFEPISYEELMRAYQANSNKTNTISCDKAINYIETNAFSKEQIGNYRLDSSWLRSVTNYVLENENYVVIEVKENEYSYKTKKYIFCGVLPNNWRNFKNSYEGTYGERFHRFIYKHKCNCE